MKRLVPFLAILVAPTVTLRLLAEPHLQPQRYGPTALFAFAALLGFGGSCNAPALSKWMATIALLVDGGVRVRSRGRLQPRSPLAGPSAALCAGLGRQA